MAVKRSHQSRRPPEPLTPQEAASLLYMPSSKSTSGLMARAMIAVMYRAGLRLGELLALYPKDLDEANGLIRVLHGKGDKSRVVGMDPNAWPHVGRWLERRATLGLDGRHPLFCTISKGRAGNKLDHSHVQRMVRTMAQRAGIERRVCPHGLRHTMASELAAEGVPLQVIGAQLGHTNLATTDAYIRKLRPPELANMSRLRKWDFGNEIPVPTDVQRSELEDSIIAEWWGV